MFFAGKRWLVGRESAFFEFFLREVSTTPTPGSPHIPQRWRPQPPAHPERLHSTDSGTAPRQATQGDLDGGGTLEGGQCVRNCADLDILQRLKNISHF